MNGFDREYYRRFYFDPRTAVVSRAEMRARARLIAAYAQHIGLPVRRMLDAGFTYATVFSIVGFLHVTAFGVIMLTIPNIHRLDHENH